MTRNLSASIFHLESRQSRHLALAALLVLAAALSLWRFDAFQVGIYTDDAHYVVLAHSLMEGPAYGLVSRPVLQPTKYPFGWPLLLAPLVALTRGELAPLKLAPLALTLANCALLVLGWPRLGLPRDLALPVGFLYATSPLVVDHSRMLMSEPAFLFFVLAGLVLTTAAPRGSRWRMAVSLVLGVVWVLAAYTRTIGVTLVAASAGYLLLRRHTDRLALAAVAATVFALLLVAVTPLRFTDFLQGGGYATEILSEPAVPVGEDPALGADPPGVTRLQPGFTEPPTGVTQLQLGTLPLSTRIGYGLQGYGGTTVRDTLVPFVGGRTVAGLLGRAGLGWLPGLASALILLAIAAGFAVSVRTDGIRAIHLFVAFYAAATIVWMWAFPRLLYGVLPLLLVFMLLGVAFAAEALPSRLRGTRRLPRVARRAASAVLPLTVALLLVANVTASLRIGDSRAHTPDLSAGTSWIWANTPPDGIVLSANPEITYAYTDRRGIPLPTSLVGVERALAASGVAGRPAYILLAPDLVWSDDGALQVSPHVTALRDALSASPHALLVHAVPEQQVYVYEWLPDGSRKP